MVALTCDFHVFATGFATRISAVFLPSRYLAKTRYVRTHLGFLLRHVESFQFQCVSIR